MTHITHTHQLAAIRTQRDSVIAALSDGMEVEEAAEEAAAEEAASAPLHAAGTHRLLKREPWS